MKRYRQSCTKKQLDQRSTLAEKLTWLMECRDKHISQVELAGEVGVTSVWINKILHDHERPSDSLLKRIAAYFSVPAVWLFDDDRKKSLGM